MGRLAEWGVVFDTGAEEAGPPGAGPPGTALGLWPELPTGIGGKPTRKQYQVR